MLVIKHTFSDYSGIPAYNGGILPELLPLREMISSTVNADVVVVETSSDVNREYGSSVAANIIEYTVECAYNTVQYGKILH